MHEDVGVYRVLISVRQRRGTRLHEKLNEARCEHMRCLEQHAEHTALLAAHIDNRDHYARLLISRTLSGAKVRVGELEAARIHDKELQLIVDQANQATSSALKRVNESKEVCQSIANELAANEARISILRERISDDERASFCAQEDLEEEVNG